MAKKLEKRRFEDAERKPWTKEQREKYEATRTALAPFIKDLTTPARTEKRRDPIDVLLGVTDED